MQPVKEKKQKLKKPTRDEKRKTAQDRCWDIVDIIRLHFEAGDTEKLFEDVDYLMEELSAMNEALEMETGRKRRKPPKMEKVITKTFGQGASGRVRKIVQEFCKKWGVRYPLEITRINQEARDEWNHLLADSHLEEEERKTRRVARNAKP